MKIQNEQLQALHESEPRRAKAQYQAEGFEALLSKELGAEQVHAAPALDKPSLLLQGTLPSTLPGAVDDAASPAAKGLMPEEAADRVEDLFATLEQYAGQLARNDKANLRQAFSLLENMTSEIGAFRSSYPDMETSRPELAALVNELDVLASTETFKFNRGDYL